MDGNQQDASSCAGANTFDANREYKDSLFSLALGNEQAVIQLSNALLGTNYGPDTAVDISTVKKLLANCRMNDLSYIIDNRLIILIEHQSTINENMPYRMMMFFTESMKRLHAEKDEYRRKMFKIQRPKFIVLYNGVEEMKEDVITMRLSDMFADRKSGDPVTDDGIIDLELTVTVYNINKGRNEKIVNSCAALREYSIFINTVREYQAKMSVEDAIQKAVVDCIDKNVLKDILLKHKGNVVNMIYSNFNMGLAIEVAKEEGAMERAVAVAKRMIADGKDVGEIVKYSGLDQNDVLKLMGVM